MTIKRSAEIAMLIATLTAIVNIAINAPWYFTIWALVPVAFWLLGRVRKWQWGYGAAFTTFAVIVIIASFYNYNNILLLITIIAALFMWDLETFHKRLEEFDNQNRNSHLIRTHRNSLIAIAVLSAIAFTIATGIRLELGLWTAIMLGILLVVGFAQALRFLRESDL